MKKVFDMRKSLNTLFDTLTAFESFERPLNSVSTVLNEFHLKSLSFCFCLDVGPESCLDLAGHQIFKVLSSDILFLLATLSIAWLLVFRNAVFGRCYSFWRSFTLDVA